MRHIAFILLILLAGCNTPKYAIAKEESNEGGAYTFEVLENKSLVVKDDITGKLYYTVKENPGTNVAVYKYTRKKSGDYQDDFYDEEVVFEFTGKKITTESINKNSMLFGVRCYCKGKAGHYKIENAIVNKEGKNISIAVPVITDNQVITHIYIKSL